MANLNTLYERIDQVFLEYIQTHSELHEGWLLEQTLYTGPSRRSLLGMLPIQSGMRILDLGCGFGALTFDLAAAHDVSIDAVDMDAATLDIAKHLYAQLRDRESLAPDSSIEFVEANAYQLPFEDHSLDFVVSQYVFQHLTDPLSAMLEIRRVLKPKGFACIIDIDDQLTITYPEETSEFTTLKRAFTKLQYIRGGDRQIGRKLASHMKEAGMDVLSTLIQPSSSFTLTEPSDLSYQVMIKRFTDAREEMIHNHLLSDEEFDSCLNHIGTGYSGWQYNAIGQMVILGQA